MGLVPNLTLPSLSFPPSSLLGSKPTPGSNSLSGPLPWASQPPVTSKFFPALSPKGELWDKLLPYRLVVIDTSQGNKVVGGNAPSDVQVNPLGNGTLAFTPISQAWEFFLPITPQQLSIGDAYAITTSATLKGVLEEHSGVRFKNITIQGTFGIWPGRPSIVQPPTTPSALESIFGGTIAAAQNVASQFSTILNTFNTGSGAPKPITVRPGDSNDPENGLGTGYYQMLLFTQFLEQYAEAKRNPANAGWRLVFDIPKQNQSFVVTPVGFTWSENVNRPMEIDYNLQLKGWRRINLKDTFAAQPSNVVPLTPGVLQNILNTISAAQNTAAAAFNLIGSVRSDVDNVLNVIRQTGLFVKQLGGVALAVNDLPAQLVSDASSTISDYLATTSTNTLTGSAASDSVTISAIAEIIALAADNEGLSGNAVASGQNGQNAAVSSKLNPSTTIFSNPLQYPLLFSQVPVSNLKFNTAQQNALQTELDNVNSFTVADLKNMRSTILSLCLQLSNSFGAGDAYYSNLFNQPAPIHRDQPMTLDEYDTLQSFYDLLQSYDVLTATNQITNEQSLNSLEYVQALAQTSSIPFVITQSKIQVPVPFGLNMEQISLRYLGDAQRWLEIVTLNELREPYIDENGFQYSLLSNADGRNIVVGGADDLYVGQTVFLNSNTQSATARHITNIVQLSQTSFLITLDGLANLNVFKLTDQAYIQAYLPGTVNSQNVIFVPSTIPAPTNDQISIPSSVANVDLVGLSKVDLLLTPYGDLAIDNMGSFRFAAGITNLIQALAIKFGTTLGSDLLNPKFGLGFKVGTMNSDVKAADLYNQVTNLITSDPRFSAVSGLQVTLNGPSLGINLGVNLAGISGVFPVGFTLPTSS